MSKIKNKLKLNSMSENNKPNNDVRISIYSKPKQIISQCEKLLKEEKVKDLHLSAMGNSIGKLVITAEILKQIHPELFEQSIFSINKDEKNNPTQKTPKLLPRLEIIFTTEKPTEKKESTDQKISEGDRNALLDALDKQKYPFLYNRRFRRRRNFTPNSRRWRFNGRRNQRYAFSAKRTGYGWRRPAFNNRNIRRPFGKPPVGRRNNMGKFNGSRKNSGNKPVTAKN